MTDRVFSSLSPIQPYFYQSLPSPQHIRYLRLQASSPSIATADSNHNQSLTCYLETTTLSDLANFFHAISYVWGKDPTLTHSILILPSSSSTTSSLLPITSSLHSVLTSLLACPSLYASNIWIDGICINQSSPTEKSQQVGRMIDIYKAASSVITYISPASPNYDLALNFKDELLSCYRIVESEGMDKVQHLPAYLQLKDNDNNSSGEGTASTILGKGENAANWTTLNHLLNLPWSSRLWILQESLVNPNMLMLCGSKLIDWHDLLFLGRLFQLGRLPLLSPQHSSDDDTVPGALYLARLHVARAEMKHDGGYHRSPAYLLRMSRLYACSDPRDKVYAMLGLVDRDSFDGEMPWLTPDYSKSVVGLYIEAAVGIISHDGNLDLLQDISHPATITDLPSWVPDWTVPARKKRFTKTTFRAYGQTAASFKSVFSENLVEMTIEGYMLGDNKIEHIWPGTEGLFVTGGANTRKAFVLLLEMLLVLRRYHRHSKTEPNEYGTAFTGLWRTLIADTSLEGDNNYQNLPPWSPSVSSAAISATEKKTASPAPHMPLYLRALLHLVFPPPPRETLPSDLKKAFTLATVFRETARSWTEERHFAITSAGHPALVPEGVELGDVIFLAVGARTPLILRPTELSGKFWLVGPAYVEGMMYGEECVGRELEKVVLV